MARMQALIGQRGDAAAEVERLDAEIRLVAQQLAGGELWDEDWLVGDAPTVGRRESTAPPADEVVACASPADEVVACAPPLPIPPPAPPPVSSGPRRPAKDTRLARRKVDLLKILQAKPDGDVEYFATKMYGNDGRTARVNVSSYFSDLKADGYVEPGERLGSFRLLEKGLIAIHEAAAQSDMGAAMGK